MSTQTPAVSEQPRVIQIEEIALPCPEPSLEAPHQVVPVEAAVMPEAIGVWVARCEPGRWAGYRHEFVYDGRYVTIVYAPMNAAIEQYPRYLRSPDHAYRLESRWEGQTLWARLPPGDWVAFAHFEDGRFGWSDERDEIEHTREGRLEQLSLIADRSPHDYGAAGRSNRRRRAVFATLNGVLAPCFTSEALTNDPQFQLEQESRSGNIEFHLGSDGQISEVVVNIPFAEIAACVQAAFVGVLVEGYSAPESVNYRYPFMFSPE